MSAARFIITSCAILAFAMGMASTSAQATPRPTAADILAKAKAAAGGNALDAVQTVEYAQRVHVLGESGTAREYDDVAHGRFASFADLGPLSNGNGFDGTHVWVQDPSGDAWSVGDFVNTRSARSAAYATSLSYWYPNRVPGSTTYKGTTRDAEGTYYVIRANPSGGFPIDIWFDASTYLIKREILRIPNGRDSVTTLTDYRQVNNVVLPFRNSTAGNGNTFVTTVSAVTMNRSIGKLLQQPATQVADALIAGGQSTTIPFDLVNNHLFVSVRLNGRGPYRFILDTGGQNLMTPDVAMQLGSGVTGALQVSGAGANTVTSGFAWVPTVQIGAATLRHQAFAVLPIGKILKAVEGRNVDGIVGVELLRRFITTVDYQHQRITFSTRLPAGPIGTAVPFVFDQDVPQVAAEVDGLTGRFIIDTGNRTSLVLYAPFVASHKLIAAFPSNVSGVTGFGLGGPSLGKLVRARSITVGSVPITEPVTTLSLDKTGALTEPGTAGNIGGGILKRFTVTFDYRKQTMYLSPNDAYKVRQVYDRSGLFLVKSRAGFRVLGVLTETPAYEAGIRSGDVITQVNTSPAAALDLLTVRSQLRGKPGTRIRLVIESAGKSAKTVTFALRDYV